MAGVDGCPLVCVTGLLMGASPDSVTGHTERRVTVVMSYHWALEIVMTDVFERILDKKDISKICREQVVQTD